MVWNRLLTTGIKSWQTSYWDGFTRSTNDHFLFMRAETGSQLHLRLGWRHHSSIKELDSDLRCQEGDWGNHTLVSGSKYQTGIGQSHSWPRTLIRDNDRAVSNDQCKHSRTPADLNLKLQLAQNGKEEVDQRIYRSLVWSFLNLVKQTRLDIRFAVNILSRHMNAPTN